MRRFSIPLLFSLGLALIGTASCYTEETPLPTPKVVKKVPKPPAQLGPDQTVVRMAGLYTGFQDELVQWGNHHVGSADDLRSTMLALGHYDGNKMSGGWMATNALIALQVPSFVKGVQQWERDLGRDVAVQRLRGNVMYATTIPGARAAQQAILRAARSDAQKMESLGLMYKQQSYSMQREAWSKHIQRNKHAKIAAFKAAPASPSSLNEAELQRLAAPGQIPPGGIFDAAAARNEFVSAFPLAPSAAFANDGAYLQVARGRDATLAQALGMAAMMIMDVPSSDPVYAQWGQDTNMNFCVTMARANMSQCLAAGHFEYEASFCIAQHQIIDMGKCVGKVAQLPALSQLVGQNRLN